MTDDSQDPGQSGEHKERHKQDLRLWDRELGGYGDWADGDPDPHNLPGPPTPRRTKTVYFVMMGTCVGLCVLAWLVVDRFSTVAAIVMSAVALVIPPFAAMIANAGSATDRRSR